MAQFVFVVMAYLGIFFVFGLAWFFLARGFGEQRLPSWAGMPAAYYRDAFCLGLAGSGVMLGLSRLHAVVESFWPTNKKALAAVLPTGLDTIFPAATLVAGSATRGLFLVCLLALAAGFVATHLRRPWMQAALVVLAAMALVGSWGGPADLAKSFTLVLVDVAVIWWGVTRLFRFNLLGYFLAAVTMSLVDPAIQLFRQPAAFYRLNGYVVLAALVAFLAWPLVAWRASLSNAPGDGGAGIGDTSGAAS